MSVLSASAEKYDSVIFTAAMTALHTDARTLTDQHIAMLTLVHRNLGERARAARAGFVEHDDDDWKVLARHQVTFKDLLIHLRDYISPSMYALRQMLRESVAQIATLEARIKQLEERPAVTGVKYCGTFNQGQAYAEGSLVTRTGGLWLALRDTVSTPGASAADTWRLIVKSGGA